MEEDFFRPPEVLAEDECCICGKQPVVVTVRINREYFPFCVADEHRFSLLRSGQARRWPALRSAGITGMYAIDSCAQSWALSALSGTDERVIELLDALDEQEKAS